MKTRKPVNSTPQAFVEKIRAMESTTQPLPSSFDDTLAHSFKVVASDRVAERMKSSLDAQGAFLDEWGYSHGQQLKSKLPQA